MTDDLEALAAEVDSAMEPAGFDVPLPLLWPTVNAIIELMGSLDPVNPIFLLALSGLPTQHPVEGDGHKQKYYDDLVDWVHDTWLLVGTWMRRRKIELIEWESTLPGSKPIMFFIGSPAGMSNEAD